MRLTLSAQYFSAFSPSSFDDVLTGLCAHALKKTMSSFAF